MPPRTDPVADLAETVGRALLEFAERLRTEPEPTAAPTADGPAAPNTAKLGGTQGRILDALREAPNGLSSGDVAIAVGISATNAPRTLKALKARGLVEDGDERPSIWRLTEQTDTAGAAASADEPEPSPASEG